MQTLLTTEDHLRSWPAQWQALQAYLSAHNEIEHWNFAHAWVDGESVSAEYYFGSAQGCGCDKAHMHLRKTAEGAWTGKHRISAAKDI